MLSSKLASSTKGFSFQSIMMFTRYNWISPPCSCMDGSKQGNLTSRVKMVKKLNLIFHAVCDENGNLKTESSFQFPYILHFELYARIFKSILPSILVQNERKTLKYWIDYFSWGFLALLLLKQRLAKCGNKYFVPKKSIKSFRISQLSRREVK